MAGMLPQVLVSGRRKAVESELGFLQSRTTARGRRTMTPEADDDSVLTLHPVVCLPFPT